MATVTVTFFRPAKFDGFGVIGEITSTESITSSGTSQQSTVTSGKGEICRVVSSGGNVHVLTGANPTADSDDLLLIDGIPEYFSLEEDDVVALIDA